MGVLDQDERAGVAGVGELQDLGDLVVHRRDHVGDRLRVDGLVDDRPRRVAVGHVVVAGLEVDARPGLVAHRPQDDGGVVLVALDHPPHPVEVRLHQLGLLAERVARPVVEVAVALDVGLVDDVEPVAVGERVEARVVGVVARADGVDVALAHQLEVADHALHRDHVAVDRVVLVAVDAADRDRPAVDAELPALDADVAEAEVVARDRERAAVGVGEGDQQRVEVRRLGRPRPHVGDGHLDLDRPPAPTATRCAGRPAARRAGRRRARRRAVRRGEGHAPAGTAPSRWSSVTVRSSVPSR